MSDEIDSMINKFAKKIIDQQAQIVDGIIRRLIVENDCKLSDIHMVVKGQFKYEFMVKKHEVEFNMNFIQQVDEPIERCEHAPDDTMYMSNPSKHRCSKCGEFY